MDKDIKMLCLETSNHNFYEVYGYNKNHKECDKNYECRANEILMDVDNIFDCCQSNYNDSIADNAEDMMNVLSKQFINNFSVDFNKVGNAIEVVIGYSHIQYVNDKFILLRDIFAKNRWYMSDCCDIDSYDKFEFTRYMKLVFKKKTE